MTNFAVHVALTVIFAAILCNYMFGSIGLEGILFITIAGLSALIPDIDNGNSLITRITSLVVIGVLVFYLATTYGINLNSLLLLVAGIIIYILARKILFPKHRGYTHSIVFALIMGAVMYYFTNNVLISAAVITGITAHMLEDMMLKVI